MSNVKNILDNCVVVELDISITTGSKKTRKEDLGNVELPPEKLATLGSKHIIDPSTLKVFKKLKAQAERACEEIGVKSKAGYFIPDYKEEETDTLLTEIETNFQQAKIEFLAAYDKNLRAWLAEAGEWADIVRPVVESAETMAEKIDFGFTIYKMGAATKPTSLERRVGGLSSKLRAEIAQQAKEAFEESYRGKPSVTRKALNPLNDIIRKVEGLRFISDARIDGLVDNAKAALAAVPKSGPITGNVLMGLVGVLTSMAGITEYVETAQDAKEEEAFFPVDAPAEAAPVPATPTKAKTSRKPVEPEPVAAAEDVEEEVINEVVVISEPEEPVSEAWFW